MSRGSRIASSPILQSSVLEEVCCLILVSLEKGFVDTSNLEILMSQGTPVRNELLRKKICKLDLNFFASSLRKLCFREKNSRY